MNKALTWKLATILLLPVALLSCVQAPLKQPQLLANAEQYQLRGVNAFSQADYITAKSMFESALSAYESVDDAKGVVRTYINLVETAIRTRDYKGANLYLQHARDISARNNLKAFKPRVELLDSTIALLSGDLARAQKSVQPLLPEFHGEAVSGSPDDIELSALANRVRISFELKSGSPELWIRRFENALQNTRRSNLVLEGRLLRFKAQLAERNGEFVQAHELLRKALQEYKSALSQPGIASTLLQSGRLYIKQAEWTKAREDLRRGTAVRIRMLDRRGVAEGLKLIAKTEAELGNSTAAQSLEEWVRTIDRDGPLDWQAIRRAIYSN